jgi:hypothetical protein
MWSYRTLLSSLCRRALKDGGQIGNLMEHCDTTAPEFFCELDVGAGARLNTA